MPTFLIGDLQTCDPDELPSADGIRVELHGDLDGMGLPRVDVFGDARDRVIAYVEEHWGREDEEWFDRYVVARVEEYPAPFRGEA